MLNKIKIYQSFQTDKQLLSKDRSCLLLSKKTKRLAVRISVGFFVSLIHNMFLTKMKALQMDEWLEIFMMISL